MRIGNGNNLTQNLNSSESVETTEIRKGDSTRSVDNNLKQQIETKADARTEAIKDFIEAAETENDNFTPLNQLDLAAFTRVAQNDSKNTKATSDLVQEYHKIRLAIISKIKA